VLLPLAVAPLRAQASLDSAASCGRFRESVEDIAGISAARPEVNESAGTESSSQGGAGRGLWRSKRGTPRVGVPQEPEGSSSQAAGIGGRYRGRLDARGGCLADAGRSSDGVRESSISQS
jgi:hypothetical protein